MEPRCSSRTFMKGDVTVPTIQATFQYNTPELAMHGFCNIFAEEAARITHSDIVLLLNDDDNSLIHALVLDPATHTYFDADNNQATELELKQLAYTLFDIDDTVTPIIEHITIDHLQIINQKTKNEYDANPLSLIDNKANREYFKHWCQLRTKTIIKEHIHDKH